MTTEVNTADLSTELSEDIEVMGPGQILAEAREKANLTQQQVAEKLNFRKTLVNDIEHDVFDKGLPETFNRGYLRNYAKLVNVSEEDVLASYELLNIAKTQSAELQSFSKGTEKQAENNIIMSVSYLILAILIGSTVLWWWQESEEKTITKVDGDSTSSFVVQPEKNSAEASLKVTPKSNELNAEIENTEIGSTEIENTTVESNENQRPTITDNTEPDELLEQDNDQAANQTTDVIKTNAALETSPLATTEQEIALTDVVFTFSGDCWVNISDATGERIAWGVKKQGYVMTISGQAPFNITLGKPEIVSINFDGKAIDMNQFDVGNIAKFKLPLVTN
jgi:cytoskeleton protein RodZ